MSTLPKGLSITPYKGITIARLYNTNIVTIDSGSNTITLNNGGWNTKHTKKCMNIVLAPFNLSVKQKDFEWFIVRPDNTTTPYAHNIEISI